MKNHTGLSTWVLLMATTWAFAPPYWGNCFAADMLQLQLRHRVPTSDESPRFHILTRNEQWRAEETAVIVCDMWDLHHSINATRRLLEVAPRMNRVLQQARRNGALIIHAPSSCMDTYANHPARRRALETPRAANIPADIGGWCTQIPEEEQGIYPIDQSDGGEDDDLREHQWWAARLKSMGRNPGSPWKSQVDILDIKDEDVISDKGEEIWSVMEQHGIKNVILMGVHTNMCVLGRPFGLRQMAKNGKNVVLMRDMTDTMYNPARWPYVSHFTGNDLIVEHIEKWVCPTITSDQILGGVPFRFKNDKRPHVLVIMAEPEYESEKTLPRFAARRLGKEFRVSCVYGSEEDEYEIPGLELLAQADVALIAVRRRPLPKKQMDLLRQFAAAGKSIVGVRTANHAFSLRGKQPPEGTDVWEEFDRDIIGGSYSGHHGRGATTAVTAAEGASNHALLSGVELDKLRGFGSLYKVSPLREASEALLIGEIPEKPPEPVAWTSITERGSRVFYTSLAAPEDFEQPAQNRLLLNALRWAANLPIPGEATVETSAQTSRPPNIIYIMADDLGYAHLGCYGQRKIRTPNIDQLAVEGTRFSQVYAGCNVCAPCRSVLMTGLHLGHTPVRGNSGGISLRDEDITVGEVLKQAGYATGAFGKWGVGDAFSPGAAYNQGFDEFFGYYDQVHAHSYYPPYLWHNDKRYPLPGNSGRESDGLTGERREQYTHDEIMNKALEFIRRNKDRPFFCYVPSTIPHTELLVPEDSLSEYAGKWPEPTPYVTKSKHYSDQLQPRAAFAAMVTRLDSEVGRIMQLLEELDLDDNTIVFFTSDNGAQGGGGPDPAFFKAGGPLRGFKGMMYEGGLRVPMIVRWPGKVAAGAISDHVWYFADVLPTLAELAGVEPPAPVDGVSVAPTLLGQPGQKSREYLYWERSSFDRTTGLIRSASLSQAVRLGDWKAIRAKPQSPIELYDLARDVSETTDVAAQHPAVLARIEEIFEQAHEDPPPQREPESPPNRAFR